MIHPKARPLLSKLSLPSPIKKYFSAEEWNIDLSNNTNPYMGWYAEYPDIMQKDLKEIYLNTIASLNFSFTDKPLTLTHDNVLFTVGSMEGLDLLLRAFSEPNQDVICIATPTFPAYEHWALIHNLRVETVPLLGENLNLLPQEDILSINPKIVFLCDPNNPTGTKCKAESIKNLCDTFDGLVVVDEAYIEFSDQPSSLSYLSKYDNLIILRTLSKAWGMAGLRCGVILASKQIIHTLRYIQLPFGFSTPAQERVKERLLYPEETFATWEKITKNRTFLMQELSNLKSVRKVFQSSTNFLMVVLENFHETLYRVKQHHIHVLDCSASVPNSIRVSLGTEEQNQKFLTALC
ncbi:MAG: aminotransferase class I/II-fold pyridoxal phosphate-dependent enzyme [Alphaproteobacteria bacterium]|nr:aminotransferase class I/II-fold pyridoxal phosphate-dependent enzyme [Alphaproteobacteria bacterium]